MFSFLRASIPRCYLARPRKCTRVNRISNFAQCSRSNIELPLHLRKCSGTPSHRFFSTTHFPLGRDFSTGANISFDDGEWKTVLVNRLYEAHFAYNHYGMFRVLDNYIEMEEPDVLEGDVATKQFLIDIAIHSATGTPRNFHKKLKRQSLEYAIRLFKKYCAHDKAFLRSSACPQMASEILSQCVSSMSIKNHLEKRFYLDFHKQNGFKRIDYTYINLYNDLFAYIEDNDILNLANIDGDVPDDVRLQIEKFERTFHRLAVCMYSYAGNYARAESLVKRLKKKVKFKHNSAAQYATLFLWKCGMSERNFRLPEVLYCLKHVLQITDNLNYSMWLYMFKACAVGTRRHTSDSIANQYIKSFTQWSSNYERSEYSPRTDNIYALMINCCRAKRKNKALHLYKELRTSFDRRSKGRKGFVKSKAPDKGMRWQALVNSKAPAKSFSALLGCYHYFNNENNAEDFDVISQLYTELIEEINDALHHGLVERGRTSRQTGAKRNYGLTHKYIERKIVLTAYLAKCVEFKRFDVVKDVYNKQIKQRSMKIPARCIVPLLEAAMLEAHESSPSSKNKKFHAGFKFYRDEIRQRNKKLNSSEYHEIISTFRSDIMDKNCIYMRYQADKIFAEGLREGAIIMPSSINKNGLIEKWDLHQIFNRQTVLVAVRYICRNFGIRENGEAEKRNIEIVIGRGASEGKAHRYMGSSGRISDKVSVASEYLRKEGIRFRITGKGGSILLDGYSVIQWQNKMQERNHAFARKDSAAAGGKGRKGSMEKNKEYKKDRDIAS